MLHPWRQAPESKSKIALPVPAGAGSEALGELQCSLTGGHGFDSSRLSADRPGEITLGAALGLTDHRFLPKRSELMAAYDSVDCVCAEVFLRPCRVGLAWAGGAPSLTYRGQLASNIAHCLSASIPIRYGACSASPATIQLRSGFSGKTIVFGRASQSNART